MTITEMEENMAKKEKTITVKITEKVYEEIKQTAQKEGISISECVRSQISGNISKNWIKKTTVQKDLSRALTTLDKYEENNMKLTDAIRKELVVLWKKL